MATQMLPSGADTTFGVNSEPLPPRYVEKAKIGSAPAQQKAEASRPAKTLPIILAGIRRHTLGFKMAISELYRVSQAR